MKSSLMIDIFNNMVRRLHPVGCRGCRAQPRLLLVNWHCLMNQLLPVKELPWKKIPLGDEGLCPGGRRVITTPLGDISCLVFGRPQHPLAICLHGYPSSAESCYGSFLLRALVHAGYRAAAIDMPGCGKTTPLVGGKNLKTRSDFCLVNGGPADIVKEIIVALFAEQACSSKPHSDCKAVIIGYDWGGGIALSMAGSKKHRRYVQSVVAFHPSYSEPQKGHLARSVGVPTSVIWCQQDQFHHWGRWKPLANSLKTSLGSHYKQLLVKEPKWGQFGWSRHQDAIERHIVKFLTGRDPVVNADSTIQDRPKQADRTVNGHAVVCKSNILLKRNAAAVYEQQPDVFLGTPSAEAIAMQTFRRLFAEGKLEALYTAYLGGGGVEKREAGSLFAALPQLSPLTLQSPHVLVKYGLWDSVPSGWHAMQATPRYFPGRRVLVRAPIDPCIDSPGFMHFTSDSKGSYSTFNATIVSIIRAQRCARVAVACTRGLQPQTERVEDHHTIQYMDVKFDDILRMNHPQTLPCLEGQPHEIRLEDSLRCNYHSPLMRAKQCEIALSLWHKIVKPGYLDFDSNEPRKLEVAQCLGVATIRGCLNITSFQRNSHGQITADGQHERDRRRYCGDDIGRFAVNGQGHCHTMTSVMASFLYPWQRVLGIDLRYRGGHSFSVNSTKSSGACVYDTPEGHQWLEFSVRPSMATFVCDLYCEDGRTAHLELYRERVDESRKRAGRTEIIPNLENDAHFLSRSLLCQPAAQAYQHRLYANGQLHTFCGRKVKLAPYVSSDTQH
eukprot:INCI6198.1.p1 GENE.INCI6198.1~~INCI6198.1.p1  ORF type:complete len:781 (-),score=82.40 INCI6198.1:340-2682(-)